MTPTRIVAIKKKGQWTAKVGDGETVAHGAGETYTQAIEDALAQPDSILFQQICGNLRHVPRF